MGRKRRQQICSAFLEDLPNELFAEIFSYLNGIDAIFAFTKLNFRFEKLLHKYCEHFDFKFISKFKFDLVYQYNKTQQWKSLQISDDAFGLVDYFSEVYTFSIDFSLLKSLTIINLNLRKSYSILTQISSLQNLVSLTIKSQCGELMPPLHLPNLKRFVLSSCSYIDWIKDFTQLQTMEHMISNCHWFHNDLIWPSTLTHFKLIFEFSIDWNSVQRSLVRLVLLNTLEIYQKLRGNDPPNGQIWGNLIRSSLPLLKTFKFYFQFCHCVHLPNSIEEIIASFSTSFYTLEKKWFIRCDTSQYYYALLYSLPFPFEMLTVLQGSNIRSITTLPNDITYSNIFSNIKTLQIWYQTSEPNDDFQRNNIVNLLIANDFPAIKWMHVLNNLQHLEMDYPLTMSPNNFLYLLENAPHLCSLVTGQRILELATEHWRNISICNQLSQKIVSLKFSGRYGTLECIRHNVIPKISEIFSSRCQHLSLSVPQLSVSIIYLILNMSQLQSLHIALSDQTNPIIDITWLEKQQTIFNNSNCMIFSDNVNVHFWLGKRPSHKKAFR
ncbi:hypothetical protein I4U23_003548 [Adineta vaga]|nr:hypothetical protein I4U23_003548 [Adineta vaga]